jgi:hypothetical protein
MLTMPGQRPPRQASTFHSPSLAQKWVRDTIDALPAEQRGKTDSSIRVFANRAQAETFAREWLRK